MNKSRKMITFIYSSGNKEIFKSYVKEKLPDMPGVHRNFPLGTFYDEKRKQVYMFFRQGEAYTVKVGNPKDISNMSK